MNFTNILKVKDEKIILLFGKKKNSPSKGTNLRTALFVLHYNTARKQLECIRFSGKCNVTQDLNRNARAHTHTRLW